MYNDLDPLLHSQLRLAIISMLVASEKVEFTHIQSETKAAAGNIFTVDTERDNISCVSLQRYRSRMVRQN